MLSREPSFATLVNDHLMSSLEQSVTDPADAKYFPPDLYTSEEWFEFEKAAIFERNWLCVGRADQVAKPGDYFTIEINNDPLVVVNSDGQIRVMSNVCQHRGHIINENAGNITRGLMRCPLHSWSYNLDGKVVHTPEMHRTNWDKANCSLPQLKVELWQGFIFCHYDHEAKPLAPTLVALENEMKNYGVEEMVSLPSLEIPVYPWNWKIMIENFMEPYHNAYLHAGVHDFALGHSFCEHSPDENVFMHPTGFDRRDGAFNPIHRALLPPIEKLTDEQRQRVMFAAIPPMTTVGLVPDHMFYFIIMPKGANQISLRIGLCVPPESTKVENFDHIVRWIVDGVMMYNDQDVKADTLVQRGLKSKFAPRGPFSWKETTIVQLNRWLVARYRSYAEQQKLITPKGPSK